MQENRRRSIAAFMLIVLSLAACGLLYGLSAVRAAGQSGVAAQEKGLADVRPIVVTGERDQSAHIDVGWKLFLVGTNTYVNLEEKYDLHYSVQDVVALRDQFIALGVPAENITLLTSNSRGGYISDKNNIDRAFDAFINSLQAGDAAFVYLSGHGFYFKTDNQPYYAPRNIVADTAQTIRDTGVSINDMMERLKESPATFKWMTVDACRNDPTELIPSLGKKGGINVSGVKSFIVETGELPKTFVFMQGCEDGQFSLESSHLGHGLLTHSLLEALQYDDNPADKDHSGNLKLMELLSYVQDRTNELAHLCRDSDDRPLAQKPAITNFTLQNAIFLKDLRHDGLTPIQLQEIADFENYLANSDIDRAEDALMTIVGFFPEGDQAQRYIELNERLQEAKRLALIQREAEEKFKSAQKAFDSEKYVMAKKYIDEAIKLNQAPKYTKFRADLAFAVDAEVEQAIADGNAQKAEGLNKLLAELDAGAAEGYGVRIAALKQSRPASPTPTVEPQQTPRVQPQQPQVVDSESNKAGALKELTIAGVKVNFRWAPAGSFLMGSPASEKEPIASWEKLDETQHNVELSNGFWIAETETSQELWQAVMSNNPSEFTDSVQLPVDNVSWNDCHDFVEKLNGKYSDVLPVGYKYAMPTEAQWEYACRAGTETVYNFGNSIDSNKANYDGNLFRTRSVKSYTANEWGLYNMHGNVIEWCSDLYDEDYYTNSSAGKDPTGPSSGYFHVLRGGSWSHNAKGSRSAARSHDVPSYRDEIFGFRLVLVQDSQQQAQTTSSTSERQYPNGDEPEVSPGAGDLKTLTIAGVEVNFHWAPAGQFVMGSPEYEIEQSSSKKEKQHTVELTKGFWIAETETTQELWLAVMGENPSGFKGSNQLPVENISWKDCRDFVEKLNNSYSRVLPEGYKYSMPTEAQWEYACRAGTTTPFSFGSTLNGDKANCDGNNPYGTKTKGEYKEKTTPVKSYEPNEWDLYDMHGNVWEWCWDWFESDYYTLPIASQDPVGPNNGSSRVLRGGAWYGDAKNCRSAYRASLEPDTRGSNFGFRLVLVQ